MKWLVSGVSSVLTIILECIHSPPGLGIRSFQKNARSEPMKWLVSGVSSVLTIILECIAYEMVG